jgi:hypothetical protein
MTELLKRAFSEASRLPEGDQDLFGKWMLAELAAEKRWEHSFTRSQDLLAKLGHQALNEHRKDRSKPLDPEAI